MELKKDNNNTKEMPARYDPKVSEKKWVEYWDEKKVFDFDKSNLDKDKVYSIDTPPPYASADHLHVGHAMHYSQFEFVARYKRMRGFNVLFPMGFDDNGLPTERFVEKKYKVNKSTISRSEFIKMCIEETQKVGQSYKKMWSHVGLSVDWSLLYSTISPYAQKIAQRSFIDLYNKKRLERTDEPVMWCARCQTAIAQADLDDIQKNSKFSDIKFKFKEDNSDIIISTTRPELIPACVGLFVHPDDDRYKNYVGKKAIVPLFDYEVPIMTDESVAMDIGTGFMMVCTWGDSEDVEKTKKNKLEPRLVIDEKGIMNDLAKGFKGMKLIEARKAILEDLESKGLITDQKDISHVTNVHERCQTPIEFYKTPQWFIKILDKKEELLKQVDKINWYPKYMKIRAQHWIENLKWDWCISRQRFYGIPFPVWYCVDCGKVNLPDESELPVNPMEQSPLNKCECGSGNFEPEKDVMDTWMTSSLTPQIALKWSEEDSMMKNLFPSSLRPQGHDIIRTWAFYTIIKSYYHENSVPWTDIMISGHGQDSKGKKMSKSLGNVVSVNDAIDKYSADALRFWAASVSLGDDLPYMEKDLVTGTKIVNKLWNASKFAIMHLNDYNMEKPDLKIIDKWLLSKLHKVIKISTDNFDKYEYSKAKLETEKFFWHTLCDNYLEISKDRLYNPEIYGVEARQSAQSTLYTGFLSVLKLFAPIMPFITEEVYNLYFKENEGDISIHNSSWPVFDETMIDEVAIRSGDIVVDLVGVVRKYKSENNLSLKEELSTLTIKCSDDDKVLIESVIDDIKSTTKVKEIVFGETDMMTCSNFEINVGIIK